MIKRKQAATQYRCTTSPGTEDGAAKKLATLYSDLKTLGKETQQPKVLVFANIVAAVKTICGY